VEEWRWQWPGKMIAYYQRGSYPGHLPRSHGVQGCEGLAKTMTGTVGWGMCDGYLAWVFVAWVQQLHAFIPAGDSYSIDDKEYC
jgi:hypothetical protein